MTRRISANPLSQWVSQLFTRKSVETARVAPEPFSARTEDRVYLLDRFLQLEALRDNGSSVKMFTNQMSLKSVLFRTGERLREGESIRVRLLLRRDQSLVVPGTVLWVHNGPQGYSGQLDLEVDPADAPAVLSYLDHRCTG